MLYLGESFLKYAHQHQTLITHKHENLITDGQEAHEKMLNITNYQKNANQNYNGGGHLRMAIIDLQTTNAGEGVEKREPSYTVGRNVNWYNHYGEQYEVPQKTENSYHMIQKSYSWAYIQRKP